MPEYIRVTDLSKVYRKHEAVKHISFQVGKGQIFAFLGPNGAGKSTTINILSTLLLKSSGSVCIGGMDLDQMCIRDRLCSNYIKIASLLSGFYRTTFSPVFPFRFVNLTVNSHLRKHRGA